MSYRDNLCCITGNDVVDGGGAQSYADTENDHLVKEGSKDTLMNQQKSGVNERAGEEDENIEGAEDSSSKGFLKLLRALVRTKMTSYSMTFISR
ncbi:hypothetical protein AMTR_s00086p00149710 [Amborella trichopoda]|uniref:Uncharacterized protein n=1 Tax=Amborella trichopoda TaxID=13333 RepID=W1P5G6_AMBTC|nr:hypothetical protein AMTR_s00086p00149710 [Amborella trichopoda]